jgi:hypothetical protein
VLRRNPPGVWLFAVFLCTLPLTCTRPPRPTDQELVAQFTRDSAGYQHVMTMLSAGTNIRMISSDLLWRVGQSDRNASAAEVAISEARLAEYRRILGALGVTSVVRWAPDEVAFLTWSTGFGGNTHHRGIAWLREPSPTAWQRFRVIIAPWYMFED